MTLPITGVITAAMVNVELGRAATSQLSLNDPDVRTLAGVPTGAIGFSDLRGKSHGATLIGTPTTYSHTGASTHTVPLPSGIIAGERLVICATIALSGAAPVTPSGWTSVYSGGYGIEGYALFTKIATGSEGSTVTIAMPSGNNNVMSAVCFRLTGGVSTVDQSAIKTFTATSSNKTITPNPLTASKQSIFWLTACHASNGDGYLTPPSGWTLLAGEVSQFTSTGVAYLTTASTTQSPGPWTNALTGNYLAASLIAISG